MHIYCQRFRVHLCLSKSPNYKYRQAKVDFICSNAASLFRISSCTVCTRPQVWCGSLRSIHAFVATDARNRNFHSVDLEHNVPLQKCLHLVYDLRVTRVSGKPLQSVTAHLALKPSKRAAVSLRCVFIPLTSTSFTMVQAATLAGIRLFRGSLSTGLACRTSL